MLHKLVYYGDKTLHGIAQEIKDINQDLVDLIEVMFNIMYQERGVGLAAPQIAVPRRLFVVDTESYGGSSLAIVNPRIVHVSEELEPFEEGCLSVPGITATVRRPREITVKGITPGGKEVTIEAAGMLARVFQHEMDHLNGKLIIDHLQDFERKELLSELKKIKKLNRAK